MTTMGSSTNTVVNTTTINGSGLGKNPRYDNSTTIDMGLPKNDNAATEPSVFTTNSIDDVATTNDDDETTEDNVVTASVPIKISTTSEKSQTTIDDNTRMEMSGGPTMHDKPSTMNPLTIDDNNSKRPTTRVDTSLETQYDFTTELPTTNVPEKQRNNATTLVTTPTESYQTDLTPFNVLTTPTITIKNTTTDHSTDIPIHHHTSTTTKCNSTSDCSPHEKCIDHGCLKCNINDNCFKGITFITLLIAHSPNLTINIILLKKKKK